MFVTSGGHPIAIGEFIVGGRDAISIPSEPPNPDETALWFLLIGGMFASGAWHCWIAF